MARIKKEREEEAAKRAAEEAAAAASNLQEELIRGNPLIIGKFDKSNDFQVCVLDYCLWLGTKGAAEFSCWHHSLQVKRRWDDDVVFRNQERGEPKAARRFVNDTIRNDFHRRFLNRYIK